MIRGLYVAGTSLMETNKRIDAVSNNIANSETTAFKRDEVTVETFNDVLVSKYNGIDYTHEQGVSNVKDEVLEDNRHKCSVDNGYFRVNTNMGISNNKEIKFTVNKQGYLSTYYENTDDSINWNLGDTLLGRSGKPIKVGDGGFEISKNGDVLVNGNKVDNLVFRPSRDVIGTLNAGVKTARVAINFEQGHLRQTDRYLDMALKGKGFFVVNSDKGELLTRNGEFEITPDGKIMTAEGYIVQGFNGDIKLDDKKVSVNEFGEIIYKDEIIDKFKIKDFSNEGDLRKIGSYYVLKDNPIGKEIDFKGAIKQGFVEQSNSNIITEMINLINYQRNYEAGQKVIRTHDELLGKAVTDVGVVR